MLFKHTMKLIVLLLIFIASIKRGDVVNLEQHAYVVSLITRIDEYDNETLVCGGTIVHNFWAVTAASCITGEVVEYISENHAFLRGNTSFIYGPNSRNHHIWFFQLHYQYLGAPIRSNQYDIAIIKVAEPFNGVYERPISIAPKNYKYLVGSKVHILGFGYENRARKQPLNVLRVADTRLKDVKQCRRIYNWFNFNNGELLKVFVTNATICAESTVHDYCDGDRGGPVVQNNRLIGIISAHVDCLSPRFPSVYTKVSVFYDWIKNYIEK